MFYGYLTNIVSRITILSAVKAKVSAVKAKGGVVLMPLAWGDAVKNKQALTCGRTQ